MIDLFPPAFQNTDLAESSGLSWREQALEIFTQYLDSLEASSPDAQPQQLKRFLYQAHQSLFAQMQKLYFAHHRTQVGHKAEKPQN
jgi:hypothetical protein